MAFGIESRIFSDTILTSSIASSARQILPGTTRSFLQADDQTTRSFLRVCRVTRRSH